MKRKGVKLKRTRSKQLNKALVNIEETLNDINDKIYELRDLDKGSKFFAIIGYLLMGLGGGGLLTIAVIFRGQRTLLAYLSLFGSSFVFILIMIGGFMLSHKGLTGDWL